MCALFIPSRGKSSLSAEFFLGPRLLAAGWAPGQVGLQWGTPPWAHPAPAPSEAPLVWEGLAGQGYREGWRVGPTQLQNPPLRLFFNLFIFN